MKEEDLETYDGSTPLADARQESFCQHISGCYAKKQTEAAILAGYSKKSARNQGANLCAKLHIKKRVKYLRENAAEALGISRKSQLEEILKIYNREDCGIKDKLKALEMINSMVGYNAATKLELSGKNGGAIDVNNKVISKTDDELDDSINELRRKLDD